MLQACRRESYPTSRGTHPAMLSSVGAGVLSTRQTTATGNSASVSSWTTRDPPLGAHSPWRSRHSRVASGSLPQPGCSSRSATSTGSPTTGTTSRPTHSQTKARVMTSRLAPATDRCGSALLRSTARVLQSGTERHPDGGDGGSVAGERRVCAGVLASRSLVVGTSTGRSVATSIRTGRINCHRARQIGDFQDLH